MSAAALVVLAVIAVGVTLRYARDLFVPIAVAVLFGYMLNPVVAWLVRRRLPRPVGAALVVLGLVVGIGAGVYALRSQAVAVVEQLPEAARRLRDHLRAQRGGAGAVEKTQEAAEELEKTAEAIAPRRSSTAAGGARRVRIEEPRFDVYSYLWAGSIGLLSLSLQAVVVVFLVAALLIAALGSVLSEADNHLFGFALTWGIAISFVALVQMVVALNLEHRYDRAIIRPLLLGAAYPLGYWTLAAAAALHSETIALARGPRERRVVWNIARERFDEP